jgi:tRNA threonylcarbamoyladenosine biosynthesis protein TsaB
MILGIDTASARFALALAVDGRITRSLERDSAQDHSRLILTAINEITEGRKDRITGIAVVQGPGSYAGLRVGIATAQGLALSMAIPVRGMPTLEASARASGLEEVTAIHPAGRGEYAAQDFRNGQAHGPLRSATAGELEGLPLAGEGAGELGGLEIGSEARCRAALEALIPEFEREPAPESVIEAVYLREPKITPPRRPRPAVSRS